MPEPPELPPVAHEPISVVLPAYNEEAILDDLVRGWMAFLEAIKRDYEFILVNDGSTDRTGALADGLAAENSRVRVYHRATRGGVGAALRDGLGVAGKPLLATTDCDLVYHATDLRLLLEAIDHVHLAAGVRTGPTARGRRAYRWLVRLGFGIHLKDVDCALKLFRREIFARIPIQSDGDFVHAEIIAKANFLGCMITEVPLPPRPSSRAGRDGTPWRRKWKDANRVFHRPNFGPPILSVQQTTGEEVTSPPPESAAPL